uniref:Uncharacterized protein n=1 Tax=Globodera rostochiensis TaxID=31243 RepID=A0A914IE19_GLORO
MDQSCCFNLNKKKDFGDFTSSESTNRAGPELIGEMMQWRADFLRQIYGRPEPVPPTPPASRKRVRTPSPAQPIPVLVGHHGGQLDEGFGDDEEEVPDFGPEPNEPLPAHIGLPPAPLPPLLQAAQPFLLPPPPPPPSPQHLHRPIPLQPLPLHLFFRQPPPPPSPQHLHRPIPLQPLPPHLFFRQPPPPPPPHLLRRPMPPPPPQHIQVGQHLHFPPPPPPHYIRPPMPPPPPQHIQVGQHLHLPPPPPPHYIRQPLPPPPPQHFGQPPLPLRLRICSHLVPCGAEDLLIPAGLLNMSELPGLASTPSTQEMRDSDCIWQLIF